MPILNVEVYSAKIRVGKGRLLLIFTHNPAVGVSFIYHEKNMVIQVIKGR